MDLSAEATRKSHGFEYRGENIRHVAMPLGGIGAGQIALGGDGGLRQWQIVNQINHEGFVPDSFLPFVRHVSSLPWMWCVYCSRARF